MTKIKKDFSTYNKALEAAMDKLRTNPQESGYIKLYSRKSRLQAKLIELPDSIFYEFIYLKYLDGTIGLNPTLAIIKNYPKLKKPQDILLIKEIKGTKKDQIEFYQLQLFFLKQVLTNVDAVYLKAIMKEVL